MGCASCKMAGATLLALIITWGGATVFAEQSRLVGQIVDFDRTAGTCEVELQQGGGGFTTLHLHDAMWALKKMEVGDYIDAIVIKENDKLVAQEVALRLGPVPEIDLLQGTISKVDRRHRAVEVTIIPGGKVDVLHFDESTAETLGQIKLGDRVEARVETVLEKQGPKRMIRVLVIGMGP